LREENINISQLDDLFKKGLEEHTVQAPEGMFEAIQANASTSELNLSRLFIKGVTLSLFAAIVGIVSFALIDNSGKEKTNIKLPSEKKLSLTSYREKHILINHESSKTNYETNQLEEFHELDGSNFEKKTKNTLSHIHLSKSSHASLNMETNLSKRVSTIFQLNAKDTNLEERFIQITENPCIGAPTKLILTGTNIKCSWVIGNKTWQSGNSTVYQFLKRKPYEVSCYIHNEKVADTIIDLSKPDIKILSNKTDDNLIDLKAEGLTGSCFWLYRGNIISTEHQLVYNAEHYTENPILVALGTNGCLDSFYYRKQKRIESSFKIWQNTITPNGDGKNDCYDVDIRGYRSFNIVIMDKAKRVVFSSTNPSIKWDGTNMFNKQPCPIGYYVAAIKYQLLNSTDKVHKYEKIYLLK